MASVRWVPIESNPEVLNKLISELGVPNEWSIVDVFSLDDDILPMVPQPAIAVLFLFPLNERMNKTMAEKESLLQMDPGKISEKVYFLKQTIQNACGTIALIHSIANNKDKITLDENSPLGKFLSTTADLTPEERAKHLEDDREINSAQEKCAQEGQTEAPDIDDDIDFHFIAFVNVDEELYELDGRKSSPVNHGPILEFFLKDAAVICKEFMSQDPDNMNFTVLALSSTKDI